MEKEYVQNLIEKIKKDYNLIAHHFASTREFVSEDIKELVKDINPQEKILDLGCGNGRLFGFLQDKNIKYWGIDISEELIKIAQKKYPQENFKQGNGFDLPFEDNFFDRVYSISVLHHIPSVEFRIKFLNEVYRVLRPGGFLYLRVWNIWKKRRGWALILKYTFLKIIKKSRLDFFDVFIPWKDQRGVVLAQRYLHAFRKRELEKILKRTGFKILKSWKEGKKDHSNLYLIVQK